MTTRLLACCIALAVSGCGSRIAEIESNSRCIPCSRFQSVDGTELAAKCFPGQGPAIVFIHGAFQSQSVWERQVEALAGKHTIVTFDLRGHGKSGRPSDPEAYRGDWIPAQDVRSVLDGFGIKRAVLVGWSFGSIVAANAAVKLGANRVAGLVLVSGTVHSNSERNQQNRGSVRADIAAALKGSERDSERERARRFLVETYHAGEWEPDLFQRILADSLQVEESDRAKIFLRPSHQYAEGINAAGMPVLLIHGETDNALKLASSIAAHEELDQSELRTYEGTGHWPFLERTERFNADLAAFVQSIL